MKKNSLIGLRPLFSFLLSVLGPSWDSRATIPHTAQDALIRGMVPEGRIVRTVLREFSVKTRAGATVRIEFDRQDNFQEASGSSLGKGDIFEPGLGLLSLQTIARKLSEAGHKISGEWVLEKDRVAGWYYEFQIKDKEEIRNLSVDARSGNLLKPNLK